MAVATSSPLRFAPEQTYVRDLEGLYLPWQADAAPDPELVVLDEAVAADLGADPAALRSPEGVALLLGAAVPEGVTTVAQGYAGHQFGGFSPRLGDGRALLLGEVLDAQGRRRDVHLKGSGRTPWARGGDGKAAIGPMLREHVVSEALHALGIPTTRTLAVLTTGERVLRDAGPLPGAVLVRVAASHLRVGTFEYVTHSLDDAELLRRLVDHAIERHHPGAVGALGLFEAVVDAQAALVAQWMLVGFVHGVMNTDNVTISGESIDFGPCAFMEAFDPRTVFSSIDHGGRYAYGMQPQIASWDLARFAEALLPAIDAPDAKAAGEQASAILQTFPERFARRWSDGMHRKLGVPAGLREDEALGDDLLRLMHEQAVDWTSLFRALGRAARGDAAPARVLFADPAPFDAWLSRWSALVPDGDVMDAVNPVYVPRNFALEDALADATTGDLRALHRLVDAVRRPFEERPGLEDLARPAAPDAGEFVTFCGT
jgi:serine/tyrosine/threonine adenylyltransferase